MEHENNADYKVFNIQQCISVTVEFYKKNSRRAKASCWSLRAEECPMLMADFHYLYGEFICVNNRWLKLTSITLCSSKIIYRTQEMRGRIWAISLT